MSECTRWAAIRAIGVAAALLALGCSDDPDDIFAGGGGHGGDGGQGGTGASNVGAGGEGGATGGGGEGGMGGDGGSVPAECADATECATLFGPAPCGTWACNGAGVCEAFAAGCVDADTDGYGSGVGCTCAGLDCDDNDDTFLGSGTRSCYSGPNGTDGTGTCRAGVETCTAGVVGPCVGEVVPSAEACNDEDDDCNGTSDDGLADFSCGLGACSNTVASCGAGGVVGQCLPLAGAATDGPTCNGVDDDCDGAVDENCFAGCVFVTTTGIDATGDGTALNPFRTIQAAIDWTVLNAGPTNVCVAQGTVCGQNATYANAANTTITMANGISVLGNYESIGWTRCTTGSTTIQPQTPEGVTFPATVTLPTALDGFRIDRFTSATTAAVTVNGATNVILGGLTISNTPAVTNSYGINVIAGGQATVTRGRIDAGAGTGESIALRSVGSEVHVLNNCASINASGRCDDSCGNNPSLRGRTATGTGLTHAVLLEDSPNSTIETSAMCSGLADVGSIIRVTGDATGLVIRGNFINGFGGVLESHGISMEDCGGAAPWIVDNHSIAANGVNATTISDAVLALGDCHPVIDSNLQITGGGEGQASNTTAIHCGANGAGLSSQCVVLGNPLIKGSAFGYPPMATGVRCDADGCARIAGNNITGRGGAVSYGVWLETTTAVVENNTIIGGCSPTSVGVHTQDAAARLENNRIAGYLFSDCTGNPAASTQSIGLEAIVSATPREIDVHSNDIDGTGTPNACTSRAIDIDLVGAAPAVSGIFRNNILRAGTCANLRFGFRELAAGADPRIFESNDLDPFMTPSALYIDEALTPLATAAEVNALLDITVSGVISADPLYVSYPADLHLGVGSPCVGAGTANGAPLFDMDGDMRDPAAPDIGADEQ